VQNFAPRLKDFVLGELIPTPEDGFTDEHRRQVLIYNNWIFCHQTLRINFTTYDCRRDQDTINVSTHSDVMVLAPQNDNSGNKHPYWYAHVIGIFHILVRRTCDSSTKWKHVEFLWVRWYGLDTDVPWGFKARRLPKVGFFDSNTDAEAFGFISPLDVIRAVHLIPAFYLGKTSRLLSHSIARQSEDEDEDYEQYNVAMYVLLSCSLE
jgi:hypothetical protein